VAGRNRSDKVEATQTTKGGQGSEGGHVCLAQELPFESGKEAFVLLVTFRFWLTAGAAAAGGGGAAGATTTTVVAALLAFDWRGSSWSAALFVDA